MHRNSDDVLKHGRVFDTVTKESLKSIVQKTGRKRYTLYLISCTKKQCFQSFKYHRRPGKRALKLLLQWKLKPGHKIKLSIKSTGQELKLPQLDQKANGPFIKYITLNIGEGGGGEHYVISFLLVKG